MLFSFLKQMLAKILQYPITQETFLAQWRFVKRRIYQILGMKGRTAFITAPHCRAHFMNDLHPESPMRLQVIEQALKKTHIWARMQKIVAPEVSDVQLARVHTRQYLHSLENQVPENGTVKIAEDTYLSRDSLQAARFAAGAVVKAVDMVMKKHAKNAFCGVRPPGHHAHANKASGFCFINNVAVGAMHAIAEYRLARVAIIDFDLHHGDGTEDIFQNDPRVMLLSAFEYPLYPFSGVDYAGSNPHIINSPLKAGDGSEAFRDLVRQVWLPKLASFQPQMILLSAGFDAHEKDALGHLNLQDDDFAWLTEKIMLVAQRHAQGRIVSVLEGGYNLNSLASGVKAHLASLVSASRF
ncbi:histone deacetylase family protein [Alysiella filiformis]|uniref:Acetoin utilization deacetylase AcuC n=1 Tax=Alysiella filiformis DSM 16848 TaxID=1120981 RepID=A0A286E201_9NEIS|nr:histone deacetylase family protein [Alysiella filiformis]SOD64912.1 Acetoin utilization deacetylase AcuC [Alysiella filiformis DSM 16848]